MADPRPRDDDEISLTSTNSDHYDSETEFKVDRILAQRELVEGKPEYLISWQNYPEESSSWEPPEHILDPDIIVSWRERQKFEQTRPSERFDVKRFEAKQKKAKEDKVDRKARRNAKRKRLGFAVTSPGSESENTDESDSDVEEVDDVEEASGTRVNLKRKGSPPKQAGKALKFGHGGQTLLRNPASAHTSVSGSNVLSGASTSRSPQRAQNPRATQHKSSGLGTGSNRNLERPSLGISTSSSDIQTKKTRRLVQGRPSSSSSDEPLVQDRPRPSTSTVAPVPSRSLVHGGQLLSIGSSRGTVAMRGGRAATRGGSRSVNVFAMGRNPKPNTGRNNLVANASNPTIAPRIFVNKSLEYKASLQGRSKADAAPNIANIPGGLFDPSAPNSVGPLRPGDMRRNTRELTGGSDLFVSESDDHDRMAIDRPAPRVSAPTYQNQKFIKSTCYYWDKQQRMPSTAQPCQMGSACSYIHAYREDAPIAAPPVDRYDPRTPTCFFWDRGQQDEYEPGCRDGDGCPFLHEYQEGVPVKDAPATYVPPTRPHRQGAAIAPTPVDRNDPRLLTCFWWDRNQKDDSLSRCGKGDKCKSLHEYRDGIPVRDPPKGYIPPTPWTPFSLAPNGNLRTSTCFFWDLWKNGYASGPCNRSDDACPYFHEYLPMVPISGPPWSYKGPMPRRQGPPHDYDHLAASPNSMAQSSRASISSDITKASSLSSGPVPKSSLSVQSGAPSQDLSDPLNEANSRPLWDPNYPVDSICYFFWARGSCNKGHRCPYRHNMNNSLALSPAPNCQTWQESICRDLSSLGECKVPSCKRIHPQMLLSSRLKQDATILQQSRSHLADPAMRTFEEATSTPAQPRSVKSVKFSDDLPMIDQQFGFPESEITIQPTPQQLPNADKPTFKNKMTMKAYRRKPSLDVAALRGKKVFFGDDDSDYFLLEFKDISNAKSTQWQEKWQKVESIKFDQRVLAQDFKAQQSVFRANRLQELPGCVISGNPNDGATTAALVARANEISAMTAGLVAVLDSPFNIGILMYPAKAEEWKFLQGTAEFPREAELRYIVFNCNKDISRLLSTKDDNNSITQPYRTAMIQRLLDLDLTTFLPRCPEGISPYTFFLLFPESPRPSEEFIKAWIKDAAPDKDPWILSSLTDGAWENFAKSPQHNPQVKAGVVFVHESVAMELFRLPDLFATVNEGKKPISFWCISDSVTPYPMYPSRYSLEPDLGRIRVTQLFPRGCIFLVTPSFLVAEPKKALALFQWFLSFKWKNATARTWKLVACHKLANYVLKLASAKAAEKDDFEAKNQHNPGKDALLKEKGLSYETCEMRFKLHGMLVELDNQYQLEPYYDSDGLDYDSDTSEDCDRPFVCADSSIDPDDEVALVKWFVTYSIRKLDRFKKFIVVGTDARSAPRAGRTVEVAIASDTNADPVFPSNSLAMAPMVVVEKLSDPKDDTVMGNSEPQNNGNLSADEIDIMSQTGASREDARKYLVQAGNDVQQAIRAYNETSLHEDLDELIRKESRAAQHHPISGFSTFHIPKYDGANNRPGSSGSNTSKISHSSTTAGANELRFVPRSVHPRPNSNGGSATHSHRDSMAMDIDSGPNTPSNQLLKEQSGGEIKEIKFEATTEWYKRLCEEQGHAWEHIYIEGPDRAMRQLGVPPKQG